MEAINMTNTLFIMICALLVFLMTPSLAMFYSGMVRHKNTLNTILSVFVAFGLISLQWILVGFSLSFGEDVLGGLVGRIDFGIERISGLNDEGVPNALFLIFQMMFAMIAAAILVGSFVERMKLGVIIVFLLLWSTLVYDVLAHMVWGGGFLEQRGSLDFAGGGVVHISAGVAGLIGALMCGARSVDKDKASTNSIPYAFLGAILLFIGWLGFNAGSAGEINDIAVNAFIVTIIAAASGFLVWFGMEWIKNKRPTVLGGLSGLVAGLVGITPACGFVGIYSSVIIGAVAALLCYLGISFIKYRLKWDDTLDAFGLHGIGGVWGGIATGLFASNAVNDGASPLGEGLFISGQFDLLLEQLFAIIVCVVLSAVVSYIIFKIISLFTSLRVDGDVELSGLDKKIHGEEAYKFG